MAKRKVKPTINWNVLTVPDINTIIAHFADVESRYLADVEDKQRKGMVSCFTASVPIVRERQKFWKDMIPCVERGEKIAAKVRAQVVFCRDGGGF